MTEMSSEAFYTRQLDAIGLGRSFSIGFPALNGVVQLHAPYQDEHTHVYLDRDKAGDITIKLADDLPLQAEQVVPVEVDGVPTEKRIRVFEEPAKVIKFSKEDPQTVANKDMWIASGENLVVADIMLLQTFVNTICDFVRLEQVRRRRSAEWTDHKSFRTTS